MKTKTNKPTNFFDYPMKIKKEIVSKTVENANKMQLETMKPNKQKTDWESKVMNDILKGFSCKGGKTLNGEDVYLMTKSDVDKLLKTQREEIISEIDRIEELKDEEVEIMSSDPHKSIEPEIRNQLRKEIKERLKQITNLKEK